MWWLDASSRLKGLTDAERATLAAGELSTRRALAARVARDGLSATAAKTNIDRARLRDALASYALREANGQTRPGPVRAMAAVFRNWRELVLLAALVLAVAGVRRAMGHPERVVVARHTLEPYQVIGEGDVRQRKTEAGFGTYASLDDVVGLYPLRVIDKDEPVRRAELSRIRLKNPAALRDHRVVGLAVTAQSARLAAPGSNVSLLFTPTQAGDTARVVGDVLVLDARATGDSSSVVVALRASDFDALRPLVARSTITVVREPVVSSR
jgi:flagella basal body P-ring formation protein FlgA